MKDPVPIALGEWLPDLPPLENPGALIAKNVIPQLRSYRSLASLSTFSDALSSAALGALWFQANDNTIFNFAGDAGALYRLDGGMSWTDVSQASGYAGVTNWEFVKFGERAIAVGNGEAIQYYDAGVSSLFADLPGSPPNARRAAVIRDFVVLADLEAFGPNVIQWGGYNASELWTPSRATQSDRQELFGLGGRVQKLVPGEYGVIVQEHSIRRMDYVGPPVVFQIDEVESGRGTPAPNSVVWIGNFVYYLGHDGFYRFDGQRSEPIGVNRVNQWFATESDVSGLDSMRGAVDRQNRLVLWAFRSSTSMPCNDRLIIYNWAIDKWSHAELDTELLAEYVSSGFSLDQLDGPLPAGVDLDSIPVDTDAFKGGALGLQAFTTDHKSATFSGPALTAEIDTSEYRDPTGRRVRSHAQRPLVDGDPMTTIQIAQGTRNQQTDNVEFGAYQALNRNGQTRLRKDDRYCRYRLSIAGGFNHAQGVAVHQKPTGKR